MENIGFIITVAFAIIAVIATIVLASFAINASKSECSNDPTNTARNYNIYAIVCAIISLILITIAIILYYRSSAVESPCNPPDNTAQLVSEATNALRVHATELNNHASIIKDAFGKVSGISDMLQKSCDDAPTGAGCKPCTQKQPQFGVFQPGTVQKPQFGGFKI